MNTILALQYILALVAEPYNSFGWNDDGGHLRRMARISVLNLACRWVK